MCQSCTKLDRLSVFNHYNRVRANIQMKDDEHHEWSELDTDDGMSYCYRGFMMCIEHVAAGSSISSAKVKPHPYRSHLFGGPLSLLSGRKDVPQFEKSNVLVMYVCCSAQQPKH
jgi:hypothetical protein